MHTRIGWLALLLTAGGALAPTAIRAQEPAAPRHAATAADLQLVRGPGASPSGPGTGALPAGPPTAEALGLPPAGPSSVVPPTVSRAQQIDYEVPRADPVFPVPLYSPRPELGGFFFDGEFLYWRQTNPIRNQIIAIRGFQNTDGGSPPGQAPGTFNGSGAEALNAQDVSGPGTYIPGYRFGLGYRFRNGITVEGIYNHLFNVRYVAQATLVPPTTPPPGQLDPALANTFLFSPVFNFSSDWAGPTLPNIVGGNPQGNYGIWNAAEEMTLRFEQRLEKYELRFRIPIFETEYDPVQNPEKLALRCYGMWGLRHYWVWERFQWRTVNRDANGNAEPKDFATYSNILSQPMYGPFVGWGGEVYKGHGVSLSLDLFAGAYVNFVREIVRWERGDRATEAKRSRRVYTIVPETEAHLNVWWYPIEGVQIRLGYDVMGLYNTIASPRPVDFNFGAMAPDFPHWAVRMLDGFNVGIGFIF